MADNHLPADAAWLFPEYDFDTMDLECHKSVIIERVLERGTRRDFVDLYTLREIVTLDRLLELAAIKYEDRPSFLPIATRALAYFEDAEPQPMPRLLTPVKWVDVRAYCEAAARRLTRRLSGLES